MNQIFGEIWWTPVPIFVLWLVPLNQTVLTGCLGLLMYLSAFFTWGTGVYSVIFGVIAMTAFLVQFVAKLGKRYDNT